MALSASVIWQKSGGSDAAGGGFDPSLTANMPSDLVIVAGGNTASPVVSSASYNFTSADVGDWLFQASTTTGWYAGWYRIVSVSINQATLAAAAPVLNAAGYIVTTGQAQSYAPLQTGGAYQSYATNGQFYTNTTAGISSLATQSVHTGVWAIDRSRRILGPIWSGGTTGTSATTAFTPGTDALGSYTPGKQDVGNLIQIVSNTGGLTNSIYAITAATSTIYTLDRSPGTAGSAITWNMGGSFATIGGFGLQLAKTGVGISAQRAYWSGNELLGSPSSNVVTGTFTCGVSIWIESFFSVCGDAGPGCYVSAGAQTAVTIMANGTFGNTKGAFAGITVDGNLGTTTTGILANTYIMVDGCLILNCITNGLNGGNTSSIALNSYFYKCGNGITLTTEIFGCITDTCTVGILSTSSFSINIKSICLNCATGFSTNTFGPSYYFCVGYGSTSAANFVSSGDCKYVSSAGYNAATFNFSTTSTDVVFNCAVGVSSSGNFNVGPTPFQSIITLTSDPYAGNHIGGSTDLTVNASNNTWVTSATVPIAAGTTGSFLAQDVGIKLIVLPSTNATVVAGGTGYGAGGTFTATATGGTFTTAATFTATYNSSGVVTSMVLLNPGNYSVYPSNPVSFTGGAGSGLTATTYWWIPGIYQVIGFDMGTSSLILGFAPSPQVGATGGKYRIADFRPNNVAGGGAALRGAGIGAIGQVDAIDVGAVQHAASATSVAGLLLPMNLTGGMQ